MVFVPAHKRQERRGPEERQQTPEIDRSKLRMTSATLLTQHRDCTDHNTRKAQGDMHPEDHQLRLPDGAANPYSMQAVIIAAGLDGIMNKREPGKRLDVNMYTDGHTVKDVKKLPLNLLDAIRALEQSALMAEAWASSFRPTSS
jgi:hypothetical protein